MKPATPHTKPSPATRPRKTVFGVCLKRIFLLTACLCSLTNGAGAATLSFGADVYGDNQHDAHESPVAGVNANVSGSLNSPFGTTQWNVSASTVGGALSARARYESVRTNTAGGVPVVGGTAHAYINDILYLSRGQGVVHLALTLALTGSRNATPGKNSDNGPRASCTVRAYVAIDDNVFFELSDQATETEIRFIDTGAPGPGDLAIGITYSLFIEGSAADGVSDGDYSHTAHLYLAAPGAAFHTESGQSYAPPPPALSIQSAGGNILISWPTNAPGFQLETTANPGAGNQWVPVTNAPVMVGLENVVTNSIPGGVSFYRLKK